jgi:hypothetical protein
MSFGRNVFLLLEGKRLTMIYMTNWKDCGFLEGSSIGNPRYPPTRDKGLTLDLMRKNHFKNYSALKTFNHLKQTWLECVLDGPLPGKCEVCNEKSKIWARAGPLPQGEAHTSQGTSWWKYFEIQDGHQHNTQFYIGPYNKMRKCFFLRRWLTYKYIKTNQNKWKEGKFSYSYGLY